MTGAVAWIICSCLFLFFASINAISQFSSLRLEEFSESVELAEHLADISYDTEARVRREVAAVVGCRKQLVRSRVTAMLFLLQRRVAKHGIVTPKDSLLDETRRVIDDALSCNPMDGNFWLLSGWFARLSASEPSDFYRYLSLSISTAPFEGDVLEKRWVLVAPVLSSIGAPDLSAFLPDLTNMLSLTDKDVATSVLVALRETGSWQMGDIAFLKLSKRRQDELAAVATQPTVTPSSKALKQFDFTPVGPVRR